MKSLGYAGAQAASDHADRAIPEPLWSKIAHLRALEYITRHVKLGGKFTSEALRAFAEEHGLGPPPDARAWGNITRRIAREKLVEKCGWVESANPQAHGREVRQWRVIR